MNSKDKKNITVRADILAKLTSTQNRTTVLESILNFSYLVLLYSKNGGGMMASFPESINWEAFSK